MGKSKGQVSIFLIFIFHILFLFFAMVINVGMLVHHKINLQNSVDLAAYYGAMKQSEILAAIAHTNYQIRQSWKLINFRYHILGGLGRDTHPANPDNPNNNKDDAQSPNASVFCMATDRLYQTRPDGKMLPGSEQNLCRQENEFLQIDGMKIPEFVGSIYIHKNISEQIKLARDTADKDFVDRGIINFRLLSLFVALYRVDTKNRKLIINELAKLMSKKDDDFTDLDGNSVHEGAYNTFLNNVTVDNQTKQFRLFNSMGNKICGKTEDVRYPPRWLKQISVKPLFIYYDHEVATGADVGRYKGNFKGLEEKPKELDNPTAGLSAQEKQFLLNLLEITNPNQLPELNMYDLVGVEKDPWCLTYVGATAISQPNLPFMPTSIKVPIIATAYAKAFGGKIGPWYESQWTRGDPFSKGGRKLDPTLPIRGEDQSTSPGADPKDYKNRMPNFSRFPGDDVGIISLQNQKAYGDMVWIARQSIGGNNLYDTFSWIDKGKNIMKTISNLYTGLPYMPENHDILAEPKEVNGNKPYTGGQALRAFEELAIAPDLFDIAYYSIEPNYWTLYLMRRLGTLFSNFYPRGDLGSTITEPFTIIDQMNLAGHFPYQVDLNNSGIYHTIVKSNPTDQNDPAYGRLLTNWAEKSLQDYSIEQVKRAGMFGHCKEPIPRELQGTNPTQGECLTGGRTGYSVKLVSRKFLERQDLPLGGFGVSGSILNPPPTDFEF